MRGMSDASWDSRFGTSNGSSGLRRGRCLKPPSTPLCSTQREQHSNATPGSVPPQREISLIALPSEMTYPVSFRRRRRRAVKAVGPFRPILMPFQRLRRVLETTYRVNICSSPDIVARVQTAIDKRQALFRARNLTVPETKPPVIVPALQNIGSFPIRAIDLLRKIGELTTPTWVNMATLSASWATRRYFWAIDDSQTAGRSFRLSPDVTDLDFHQKTLLSDEFGIGMAGVVIEQLFDAGSSVDVSAALKDANLYQDVRQNGTAQPDYLMWNPAPLMPYYVVECKGCQTSLAATTNQIRRGLEQVPSLVFGAGDRRVNTLVVATLMRKSGTTTYVIDPPNDDEPDHGETDQEPPSERIGKRTWRINNPDEFARRAWDLSRAQLLNWAGQFRSAGEILEAFQDGV